MGTIAVIMLSQDKICIKFKSHMKDVRVDKRNLNRSFFVYRWIDGPDNQSILNLQIFLYERTNYLR